MAAAGMAIRKLAGELRSFDKEPQEGVVVKLFDDDDLFKWKIGIFGPPDTPYAGGYFRAQLVFPETYPFEPPKMSFLDPFYHPNVYASGELCISILHPPGEDAMSGERPEERWNPTQQVRTILLSVISLLNEPNTSSPANVDASVDFRKWKEGKSSVYIDRVHDQVKKGKAHADAEGVVVPLTVEDYCIKHVMRSESQPDWDLDDDDEDDDDDGFMDDDMEFYEDDEDAGEYDEDDDDDDKQGAEQEEEEEEEVLDKSSAKQPAAAGPAAMEASI